MRGMSVLGGMSDLATLRRCAATGSEEALRATVQAAPEMSDLMGFGGICPFCRISGSRYSDISDMAPRRP